MLIFLWYLAGLIGVICLAYSYISEAFTEDEDVTLELGFFLLAFLGLMFGFVTAFLAICFLIGDFIESDWFLRQMNRDVFTFKRKPKE